MILGPKYGALATAQNNYTKQRFGGTVKPTPAPGAVPLCKQTRTQASQGSNTDVRPAHVLPKTEGISTKPSKEQVPITFQASTGVKSHLFSRCPRGLTRLLNRVPKDLTRFVTAPHASSPKGVLGLGTQLWWFNRLFVEQVRSWSPKALVALLPTNTVDRSACRKY